MLTNEHVPNPTMYRQNRRITFNNAYQAKKCRLAIWDYLNDCSADAVDEFYAGNILIGGSEYSKIIDFMVLNDTPCNPSIDSVIEQFKGYIKEDLVYIGVGGTD